MKNLTFSNSLQGLRIVQLAAGIGIALFLLISVSTFAQRADSVHYKWAKHSHSWNGIPNLTEDQEKKIQDLRTPFEKEILPIKNQLGEKRAHLRTLETADKVDDKAINGTIDEISQLEGQLMKKEAAYKQAIRKLLTDEQRIQFDNRSGHQKQFNWKQKTKSMHSHHS
jgi:Spy/CpxP family protein refolding chaperone